MMKNVKDFVDLVKGFFEDDSEDYECLYSRENAKVLFPRESGVHPKFEDAEYETNVHPINRSK